MNTEFNIAARTWPLSHVIVMVIFAGFLTGCERPGQSTTPATDTTVTAEVGVPDNPLRHEMEFDGYTLRANISRADVLNDTMIRQYGIDANPDLALLNLVIQDNNEARQDATVQAEVSVQHENLLGQIQDVDMRAVEADGYISYFGTLDASSQRIFKLTVKAQPAGTEQPLEMNFEVQLDW